MKEIETEDKERERGGAGLPEMLTARQPRRD